jgi:endonuclease/exonuclease/phosphatase family metal-dependent hydrolase
MNQSLNSIVLVLLLLFCSILIANECPAQRTRFDVEVLTLNIWAFSGVYERRLNLIINEMERLSPDIIGLQEVGERSRDASSNTALRIQQALEQRTGKTWHLHKELLWDFGSDLSGMAILSRYPFFQRGRKDLPPGELRRAVLWTQLETPFGFVNFYNTHLSYGGQQNARISQATEILRYMERQDTTTLHIATLLSGDMNSAPGWPAMQVLTNPADPVSFVDTWLILNPGDPGFTASSFSPSSRIDHNLVRTDELGTPILAEIVFDEPDNGIYFSDHFGVLTTIRYDVNLLDLRILSPADGDSVSGIAAIEWDVQGATEPVNSSIFISGDAGESWELLVKGKAFTENRYDWDTEWFRDGTRYKLKLYSQGGDNIGKIESSGTFVVNNTGNAPPEGVLLLPRGGETVAGEFEIRWDVGDADGDSLTVSLDYSVDERATWRPLASGLPSSGGFIVNSDSLPNSPKHQVRLRVSDGEFEVETISEKFTIDNPRESLPRESFSHLSGNGSGSITANVVDASQLLSHAYRITFDNSSDERKVYNVFDINTGTRVVGSATELDGVSEGPLFHGLRLLIEDIESARVNQDSTGWVIGDATLDFSVTLPSVQIGGEVLTATAYPADYRFVLTDNVVDTSSLAFGSVAQPLKFSTTNVTEERRAEVILVEFDNNRTISDLDNVFLIERDAERQPVLSWSIFFSSSGSYEAPEPGDEFLLSTLKPFTGEDVVEFSNSPTGVAGHFVQTQPELFHLFQSFPNPFNPSTSIQYTLTRGGPVKLEIWNALGQKVKTLVSKKQPAGNYSAVWNGDNDAGRQVSNGIYLYRLSLGESAKVRKMLLIR